MKLIILTRGQVAKVDDDDFERFGKIPWYASKSRDNFYAARKSGRGPTVFLHRVIMGSPAGMKIDHENHDTLDCRKRNLRVCTNQQNVANRNGANKTSKSGVRGVYWHKKAGKWTAMIRFNGKGRYLGLFAKKSDAAAAFSAATRHYFGEFGMKP